MSAPEGGWGMFGLDAAGSVAKAGEAYTNSRNRQTADIYNARMASLEAADVNYAGRSKSARTQANADRNVGEVKSVVAGRGFTTTYGTANSVADAADYAARIDALTIREETNNKVAALRAKSGLWDMQAASENPGGEALGTLISQAPSLAKRWQTGK